jgi:hypothetical protein
VVKKAHAKGRTLGIELWGETELLQRLRRKEQTEDCRQTGARSAVSAMLFVFDYVLN